MNADRGGGRQRIIWPAIQPPIVLPHQGEGDGKGPGSRIAALVEDLGDLGTVKQAAIKPRGGFGLIVEPKTGGNGRRGHGLLLSDEPSGCTRACAHASLSAGLRPRRPAWESRPNRRAPSHPWAQPKPRPHTGYWAKSGNPARFSGRSRRWGRTSPAGSARRSI